LKEKNDQNVTHTVLDPTQYVTQVVFSMPPTLKVSW